MHCTSPQRLMLRLQQRLPICRREEPSLSITAGDAIISITRIVIPLPIGKPLFQVWLQELGYQQLKPPRLPNTLPEANNFSFRLEPKIESNKIWFLMNKESQNSEKMLGMDISIPS